MLRAVRQAVSPALFRQIDILPLVYFRVMFGGIMLWEVWRYFHHDRIVRYYIEPEFWFHYLGFAWVKPLPGDGMIWLFHGLGLLAVLIAVGLFYRASITLFWLAFTYVFLLDQAQYLNHFYLICLISFLMIFIPANRAFALDAWLRPGIRALTAPAWGLWLLRGQMAIVYGFGGIAKLNPDWLAGEPMRAWLSDRTDFPLIGQWFTEEWLVYTFSYGGLLFDLLIIPALLWRRTRLLALIPLLLFHLTNARLFNIGIFPWFALAASLLFFPPSWFRFWRTGRHPAPSAARTPALPAALSTTATPDVRAGQQSLILAGITAYFAVQLFLPLRHWLYPGDPSWSEEGHTLAWHMRLRAKTGDLAIYVTDDTTPALWEVAIWNYLSERQLDQMQDNPHMILRFAHYLAQQAAPDRHGQMQLYVWSMMSLNSRAPQLLLDPTADLTREPDTLLAADWILPLVQPPAPGDPVPALLVSRRIEGVLLLVNITERPFPLADLTLRIDEAEAGADAAAVLTGARFDVPRLAPGGCVFAVYDPGMNTADLPLICQPTGTIPTLDPAFASAALVVKVGEAAVSCTGIACVIPAQSSVPPAAGSTAPG